MNKQKQSKRISLRFRMICMILLCWILPVFLIVAGAGTYILHNISAQTIEQINLSAQSAVHTTVLRLNNAITASRRASYITTVRDAWTSFEQDRQDVNFYNTVNRFLYEQYKYNDNFKNTLITFVNNPQQTFYVTNFTTKGTTQTARIYEQFLLEDILAISKQLGTGIAFIPYDNTIYMVRNLLDSSYQPYAVMTNELNSELIFADLSNIAWATQVNVWLNDAPLILKGEEALPAPTEKNTRIVQQQNYDFTLIEHTKQPDYNLRYTATLHPTVLQQQVIYTYTILGGISVMVLPLILAMFLFINKMINKPLLSLNKVALKIGQGKYGTQVDVSQLKSKEFGDLGDSFNNMSNTLLHQFEHIYKEELALRDAKIMALQSQINPHFLNNTLEIINWEARMEGNIKVCGMLESLSTMLNAAMDRKKRPLVHLSEEMMYVDAYLYIIKERLGRRLTVIKDVPENTLDFLVPRLVLQPILENAVEHGITPTQKGTIWVRAYEQAQWLILEIENDGVTTYDDLMKIQHLLTDNSPKEGEGSISLGIRNVHQRLQIIYGAESGLFVEITKKGNTLFTIKIEKQQLAQ